MNKLIFFITILLFLNHCSFDNKTGIWTGSDKIAKNNDNTNQNLEFIFKKENETIKEIELSPEQNLKLDSPTLFSTWNQSFQNKYNNVNNISFLNQGNYKKYPKISKTEVNKNILIHKDNLFFSDYKGNIGVFSFSQNQLIYKYNFYKKKLKKTDKEIKLLIFNDTLIAADNFGYIYSVDFKKNKLNWAKNFFVPFRSNLKIINGMLILSDEKNKIILINAKNGNKIDEFYTQPSKTVSKFESNLAIDNKNNILFLSTNGTLYSLNLINQKTINWIQNFKPESDIIFDGYPIIVANDKILVSSNNNITLLNQNGARIWNLNVKSSISPIISGNTIFTINDDNYLLLIDKITGKILFSKNIYFLIEKDFKKNFKKKIRKIKYIYLMGNKLLLISSNSYFIEVSLKNIINTNSIKKNPFEIASNIIFLQKEMIFISDSKRIYKVN